MKLVYLLLLPCLASAALPPYMLGKYQLETSQGFDDFMYEVGVNWFTRKIACALYPTAKNTQIGERIKINTSSTFKNSEVEFELGVPFTEHTADGRTVITTASLVGDSIIKKQDGQNGAVSTVETREFREGGRKMALIHIIPNKPSIRSIRIYKRIGN